MSRYKTILLFGAPGAGKGTQGKILGIVPGFYHLSCGEVFRSLDMGTKLGRTFMEFSSKGLLVPDDATIQMWHQNMHARTVLAIYKPHVDLLVLDGIPRNVSQAKLLSKHLDVLQIVHLMCPDKEKMMERLRRRAIKENRADDAKEEVIRQRWSVYEEETFPVLDYYPSSLVSEIDAMGSPAEVLEKVLHIVVPVQNAHFLNPAKADSKTNAVAGSGGAGANGRVSPRAHANGVKPGPKSKIGSAKQPARKR